MAFFIMWTLVCVNFTNNNRKENNMNQIQKKYVRNMLIHLADEVGRDVFCDHCNECPREHGDQACPLDELPHEHNEETEFIEEVGELLESALSIVATGLANKDKQIQDKLDEAIRALKLADRSKAISILSSIKTLENMK
jgi:hypothetical protein